MFPDERPGKNWAMMCDMCMHEGQRLPSLLLMLDSANWRIDLRLDYFDIL